jgi:serine/threonine-protein kinase
MTEVNPKYLQPGTNVGFYRIVDMLGAGGLAAVYKVDRDKKPYALKISTYSVRDLGPEERDHLDARAKREFGALAQLHHPNIVDVHAFDRFPTADGFPYLVMDYVEGVPLYDWQEAESPSLKTIAQVFIELAVALNEMHGRDVFHRDLKSDNVLIKKGSQDPIIIDFNIARPGSAYTLTIAGGLIGTPSHLTPEHCAWYAIQGDKPDFQFGPPQELHCVGYMLYELLAGEPPWPLGEDSFQTMARIQRRLPIPLLDVVPEVPAALADVVMRLIKKDPAERFQSGSDLQQALEGIQADLPETPYPCRMPKRPAPSSSELSSPSAESSGADRTKLERRPKTSRRALVLAGSSIVLAAVAIGAWRLESAVGRPEAVSATPSTPGVAEREGERTGRLEAVPAALSQAQPPKLVLPPTVVSAASPPGETAAAAPAPIVPAPSAVPIPLALSGKAISAAKDAAPAPSPTRQEKSEAANVVLVEVKRMPTSDATPGVEAKANLGVPAGTRVAAKVPGALSAIVGQDVEAILARPFIYKTTPVFPSRTRVIATVTAVEQGRVTFHAKSAILPNGKKLLIEADASIEGQPAGAGRADVQAGEAFDFVLSAAL